MIETHSIDKHSILKLLQSEKETLYRRFGVRRISLFGSYARNEETQKSDIDLMVDMPSDFDLYYDLKEYLENRLGKSVDLGMEHRLRSLVRQRIDKEVIYV